MTEKVMLPRRMIRPGVPEWSIAGDAAHRSNVITSIFLNELELEALNRDILATYSRMVDAEQRVDCFECDDAEVLIVACNTPSRMAKGAVRTLRDRGVNAGLFRPLTLWPFPIRTLAPMLDRVRRIVVVEASGGQLEDELRLALSRSGARSVPIDRVNRFGGMLPSHDEIVERVVSTR